MKPIRTRRALAASLVALVACAFATSVSATQPKPLGLIVEFDTRPQASRAQENAVVAFLESNPHVKQIRFVSKQTAFKRMKERNPALVAGLSFNPLPDTVRVSLTADRYARRIAATLRSLPGVEAVAIGR